MKTDLGSFLDPLADKFLVTCLTISVLANGTCDHFLYPEICSLWIMRDAGLLGMGMVIMGGGKTSIMNVIDSKEATGTIEKKVQVKPSLLSKANTIVQMTTLGFACGCIGMGWDMGYPEWMETVAWAGGVLSVPTCVGSAYGYVNGRSVEGIH